MILSSATKVSYSMTIRERLAERLAGRIFSRRLFWPVCRVIGFACTSVQIAFVRPGKFATHIPGNPGDAFLIFALLRWGGDHVTSLYSGYWQGPMFSSGHDPMAYTDTFLPLTLPFRAVEAVTDSPIVAMNVLYIVGWILCAECTYHLLVRLTACRSASVVGALAFTFSTIRMAQTGHFQLVYAFGIPLGLLVLFRLVEEPTLRRGALLGLVLSVQFLTTAYYGLILVVSVVGIGLVALWRASDRSKRIRMLWALSMGAVVVLVLSGPVALRYSSVQSSTETRGAYPAGFALRLGDLRTAAPLSTHLAQNSLLKNDSASRSGENFAFIGIFVAVFVLAFLVVVVGSRGMRARVLSRRCELIATMAVGAFAFAIAVGRGPILGVSMPFYDMVRAVVPGLKSMLAIVRLFVFTQLALVVVATLSLTWFLAHVSARSVRIAICVILSAFVVWESTAGVPLVRVPRVLDHSVYDTLRNLDEGIVVELPMAPRGAGVAYAYLEATRMVLASGDDQRTVNGYSGFAPPDYDRVVDTLNTFPSVESVELLRQLNVDYVMVHTKPVDTGLSPVSDMVNDSGYAFVTASQLDRINESLPSAAVRERIDANDGVVLVLTK